MLQKIADFFSHKAKKGPSPEGLKAEEIRRWESGYRRCGSGPV
jgi:hypothetical protein